MTFTVGRAAVPRFVSLPTSVFPRVNTFYNFDSLNRRNRSKYTRQISIDITRHRREKVSSDGVTSAINFQTVFYCGDSIETARLSEIPINMI